MTTKEVRGTLRILMLIAILFIFIFPQRVRACEDIIYSQAISKQSNIALNVLY